jgi:hypothetical protein
MGTTWKVNNKPLIFFLINLFSYIYDRTRPFLFDLRLNDRPFQHICLLLLFNQSSFSHSIDIHYHPISVQEFLRDLCYMLMSISSQTFEWNAVSLNKSFLSRFAFFLLFRFIKLSNLNPISVFWVILKSQLNDFQ